MEIICTSFVSWPKNSNNQINKWDLAPVTLYITLSCLSHLCHLAKVQARSSVGGNICIIAPFQAGFSHVTGLWVASWQRWTHVTPGGGWGAAGWCGRLRQGWVFTARRTLCQSRSRAGLRGPEHHLSVLDVHRWQGEAALEYWVRNQRGRWRGAWRRSSKGGGAGSLQCITGVPGETPW